MPIVEGIKRFNQHEELIAVMRTWALLSQFVYDLQEVASGRVSSPHPSNFNAKDDECASTGQSQLYASSVYTNALYLTFIKPDVSCLNIKTPPHAV